MFRLRVRRVDENFELQRAIESARSSRYPVIRCVHGGTVANWYGYPAETECIVTIAWPDGRVWQSGIERIPANKATLAGAFRACMGEGVLFDSRYSPARKQEVRNRILAEIEPRAMSLKSV